MGKSACAVAFTILVQTRSEAGITIPARFQNQIDMMIFTQQLLAARLEMGQQLRSQPCSCGVKF
ncbi:MAG: hypothetical protein Q7S15_01485, partial [bacterium]|nr:hypothetical protein [bacterium]